MDTMVEFSRDTVSKAQGFEEPEEPAPKEEEPPKPQLSKEEQEHQAQEKMRLFSEFVAAEAETSEPVIKKADPVDKPLHFKFYQNDGEEENLVEEETDALLGKASHQINKGKVELKYDHSDAEWGVSPLKPVDYTKSQLDMDTLMEPIQTAEKAPVSAKAGQKKTKPIIELTTS